MADGNITVEVSTQAAQAELERLRAENARLAREAHAWWTAPKRYPGPRRYLVADRRNSVSAAPLDRLDWARWFTDGTSRGLYLHVWSKDGETCHRVFCRHSDTPRLKSDGGRLWWLVDDRKTPNTEFSGGPA